MASEYYKWLARDVKPEEEKVLTPEEKRRNWWDYHKWHVVIVIVCIILAVDLVGDVIHNSRNKPDYQIAYVGYTLLPDDTVAALEEAFAQLGEDLNGNGKVQVELTQYQLYDETAAENPAQEEENAERGYNSSVLLMLNIETVESMIFLLEEPELFQETYQILARVDGTLPDETPDSDVPLWYSWSECPVLTGLDLGSFGIPVIGGTAEGDSQKAMENIAIACRGLWEDGSNDTIRGAQRLWDALTEGAAK